jgi:hypothetical protein
MGRETTYVLPCGCQKYQNWSYTCWTYIIRKCQAHGGKLIPSEVHLQDLTVESFDWKSEYNIDQVSNICVLEPIFPQTFEIYEDKVDDFIKDYNIIMAEYRNELVKLKNKGLKYLPFYNEFWSHNDNRLWYSLGQTTSLLYEIDKEVKAMFGSNYTAMFDTRNENNPNSTHLSVVCDRYLVHLFNKEY